MSAPRTKQLAAAVVAACLAIGVGVGLWWALRTPTAPAALREYGPPVVKGPVAYQPVVSGEPGREKAEGYAPHITDPKASAALAAGKEVTVPGPTGGSITMKPVGPTPPVPGAKK